MKLDDSKRRTLFDSIVAHQQLLPCLYRCLSARASTEYERDMEPIGWADHYSWVVPPVDEVLLAE
jgi:hypothetical protein